MKKTFIIRGTRETIEWGLVEVTLGFLRADSPEEAQEIAASEFDIDVDSVEEVLGK